jgi:hypothetical protein
MGDCNSKTTIKTMGDPLPSLKKLRDVYEKIDTVKKNHIKLSITILVLSMGLFFYFFAENQAFARKNEAATRVAFETIDPLHRIGQGLQLGDCAANSSCVNKIFTAEEPENNANPKISAMLTGFPMAVMVPALNKQSSEVASYLVAIAKKESDWGKHSPKKAGRDCYNYWGYRGSYNQTDSGYSCFDSPEQAIASVGGRIEILLDKEINTPEKLVVWKCGSSCAGHDPVGVRKWISDIAFYHDKLQI